MTCDNCGHECLDHHKERHRVKGTLGVDESPLGCLAVDSFGMVCSCLSCRCADCRIEEKPK